MKKTKVLFLIHDLGGGGAENVLVNLVNNMSPERFDITVEALFGGGVHETHLAPHVRYRVGFSRAFPGNSTLMKLFSPKRLHRFFIRERYDVEIAYLEGPSTRIVSGCRDASVKCHAWVHCTPKTERMLTSYFRSKREAARCYARFNAIHCVSQSVCELFRHWYPNAKRADVLYNTVDSAAILQKKDEAVGDGIFLPGEIRICAVGKLTKLKGFDRLARIHKTLREKGYPVHTYLLGAGEEKENLARRAHENGVEDSFTLLGYQANPYKFMAQCDIFVCSSYSEGFSTATTEALIVGNAVCTAEVSGMREMLGEHNEYGIVTENTDEALYEGIERLVRDPALLAHYKEQARRRGKLFRTEETVKAVERAIGEA